LPSSNNEKVDESSDNHSERDVSESDTPLEDSDLDEESKQMLEDVRKASATQREKMIQRYATKHNIQRFEIGDNVSVRVPRKARPAKALLRLFCQVIAKPHPDRYKLLSEHGLLDRHYSTADLERLPSTISLSLPDITEAATISLQKAAELSYLPSTTVSQPHIRTTVQVFEHRNSPHKQVSCSCKLRCTSGKCSCYKAKRSCNSRCHPSNRQCVNQETWSTGVTDPVPPDLSLGSMIY
jgi:hypothetical protein